MILAVWLSVVGAGWSYSCWVFADIIQIGNYANQSWVNTPITHNAQPVSAFAPAAVQPTWFAALMYLVLLWIIKVMLLQHVGATNRVSRFLKLKAMTDCFVKVKNTAKCSRGSTIDQFKNWPRVEIELRKNLPLGSGMGNSTSSAVAAGSSERIGGQSLF